MVQAGGAVGEGARFTRRDCRSWAQLLFSLFCLRPLPLLVILPTVVFVGFRPQAKGRDWHVTIVLVDESVDLDKVSASPFPPLTPRLSHLPCSLVCDPGASVAGGATEAIALLQVDGHGARSAQARRRVSAKPSARLGRASPRARASARASACQCVPVRASAQS